MSEKKKEEVGVTNWSEFFIINNFFFVPTSSENQETNGFIYFHKPYFVFKHNTI